MKQASPAIPDTASGSLGFLPQLTPSLKGSTKQDDFEESAASIAQRETVSSQPPKRISRPWYNQPSSWTVCGRPCDEISERTCSTVSLWKIGLKSVLGPNVGFMVWPVSGVKGRLSRNLGIADRVSTGEHLDGCGAISALA